MSLELRTRLEKQGILLSLEAGRLVVTWNGKRTPELASEVKEARFKLVILLKKEQNGHCGTCKHWQNDPFSQHDGVCSLGWSAHEHWNSSNEAVHIHGACECMCVPKRWQPKHRTHQRMNNT
jgi:hypothetical protein